MICYNYSKAGDGTIDCLGGFDERHIYRQMNPSADSQLFLCLNQLKCLYFNSLCDGINDCQDESDELFCHLNDDRRKIVRNFFQTIMSPSKRYKSELLLNDLHFFPKLTVIKNEQHSNIVSSSKIVLPIKHINNELLSMSNKQIYRPRCNHGITIQMRKQSNNSEYSYGICLCSSAYFGDLCQYQSQRIIVAIKINAATALKTRFSIVILLLNEENLIESYDLHEYFGIRDCFMAFISTLLYSTRPKNPQMNYTIRIDVYENDHRVKYRSSWLFPIVFPFLPVHRIAVKLIIPPSDFLLEKQSNCKQHCIHGFCTRYINDDDSFCQCDRNWSGLNCSIASTCNCSPNATCIGSIGNRSICLCPLLRYGPRCYLKSSSCFSNPCQNNGLCTPINEPFTKDKYYCVCSEEFSGDYCQFRHSRLEIQFSTNIPLASFLYNYFIDAASRQNYVIHSGFKRIQVYENSIILFIPLGIQIVFLNVSNQLYVAAVVPYLFDAINISSRITLSHKCRHIRELFNATFVKLHILRRMKRYHLPCQKFHELMCFYDDELTCLCGTDRYANCFNFAPKLHFELEDYTYCEGMSKRLYDSNKCPTKSICVCPECFHGSRCQFSSKDASLSFDFILGYYIRPYLSIDDQPIIVKISIIINILLSIIGLTSSIISLIVFRNKEILQIGCGQYLLGTSITSFILLIMFLLKFWMLLLSQLSLLTNETLLYIHCLFIDYSLNILVSISNWLNTFVTIDRTICTLYATKFNKQRSVNLSKLNIIIIYLLTSVSYIYDPMYRQRVNDEEEQRHWCIVQYSSTAQKINFIISSFHLLIPFLINIISTLLMLHTMVQSRSKARHISYKRQLHKQLQESKHLIISPIILTILSLPHIIMKFLPGCLKSIRDPWLYFIAYFLPFIPPFVTSLVFIYPSTRYCQILKQNLKQFWIKIHLT